MLLVEAKNLLVCLVNSEHFFFNDYLSQTVQIFFGGPSCFNTHIMLNYKFELFSLKKKKKEKKKKYIVGSKIWAHDLGPGTTFHQQYARGEEIIEDRCN